MRGDLSKLPLPAHENFTGVLYQQGRVRLDQDDNAEQLIGGELRRLLGQDVIGAGVVAVPADESAGFKVTQAAANAAGVTLSLTPGRVWVDGLHLELTGANPVVLPATYFGPPVQSPGASPATIGAGVRDAAILEVWEEALNAYQDPLNLLEPALGGPETTERIQLNFNLRLLRLAANQDCRTIAGQLKNNLGVLGKLTVTPSAVVVLGGDCPVDTGGGYTGLEHYLYRIEVTTPDAGGNARFKWSRFNGGLVGRGSLNLAGTEVTITANQQMINHCGLTDFYLEAFAQPGPQQPWTVAFTATASLVSDGVLSLSNTTGAWPAASNAPVFFRLWDGVRRIADFVATTELEDGIQLLFDPPSPASGADNYRPGDFWTFPARAAGSGFDPSVWPNNAPPQGIVYHRAPLAEIHWTSAIPNTVTAPANIEDCRRPFPPLTRPRGCCTYSVGDGVRTFGDFNSLEEAVASLPSTGGEICLLPGIHIANVRIEKRINIKIHGCSKHTIVLPRPEARSSFVFHIVDSVGIEITNLAVVTFSGTAIMVEGNKPGSVKGIELTHLWIIACLNGIVVANAEEVGIRWNFIRVIDLRGLEAIVLMAEGAWIERNDIGVVPSGRRPPEGDDPDQPPPPDDPCADPERFYGNIGVLVKYLDFVFGFVLLFVPANPFRALGGIRLAAGAKRAHVLENRINGGAGDGIHLGGNITVPDEAGTPADPGVPATLAAGAAAGVANSVNQPVANVTLSFRRVDNTGSEVLATTDGDGEFVIPVGAVAAGAYQVRSLSPGFAVASVALVGSASAAFVAAPNTLIVALRPVEAADEIFRGTTIEEVLIERNEIANMGMSGIGSSGVAERRDRLATSLAARFGVPVFQLEIDGNLIHHCMQNVFTAQVLALAGVQGLGGISLGVCDELFIGNNRIEHCGSSHVDPVVGIFAALVDHIEVRDNTIVNNGPFRPGTQLGVREGIRGGIVLRATAIAARGADGKLVPAPDQPAARIQRNVVRQPLGLALALAALGPVAVESNFFSSELRGPAGLEILAGTVLILNLASREVASLRPGERAPAATLEAARQSPLPDGKTLYTENQVRLGVGGNSLTAQLIATGGDVGYDSNQSDYLGPGFLLSEGLSYFINTLLLANSLRASDSRFKEGSVRPRSPVASLVSFGSVMNITSQNQGDHCIFAGSGGLPVVNTPNLVIDSTFCGDLGASHNAVITNHAVVGRSFS